MNDRAIYYLCFSAILGTGLVAGVFLAFSSFIMQALARLPAEQGMGAMQQINITVINPIFMGVLFGSALLCLIVGFSIWRDGTTAKNDILFFAALIYLVGVIGVTIAFNVPLNNNLGAANPMGADGAMMWARYLKNWTFWNSVRGLAAFMSCIFFICSLCTLQN
jgi:uncharacterized membrane protein